MEWTKEQRVLPPLPVKTRSLPWVDYWRDVALPAREAQLTAALDEIEKLRELAGGKSEGRQELLDMIASWTEPVEETDAQKGWNLCIRAILTISEHRSRLFADMSAPPSGEQAAPSVVKQGRQPKFYCGDWEAGVICCCEIQCNGCAERQTRRSPVEEKDPKGEV